MTRYRHYYESSNNFHFFAPGARSAPFRSPSSRSGSPGERCRRGSTESFPTLGSGRTRFLPRRWSRSRLRRFAFPKAPGSLPGCSGRSARWRAGVLELLQEECSLASKATSDAPKLPCRVECSTDRKTGSRKRIAHRVFFHTGHPCVTPAIWRFERPPAPSHCFYSFVFYSFLVFSRKRLALNRFKTSWIHAVAMSQRLSWNARESFAF